MKFADAIRVAVEQAKQRTQEEPVYLLTGEWMVENAGKSPFEISIHVDKEGRLSIPNSLFNYVQTETMHGTWDIRNEIERVECRFRELKEEIERLKKSLRRSQELERTLTNRCNDLAIKCNDKDTEIERLKDELLIRTQERDVNDCDPTGKKGRDFLIQENVELSRHIAQNNRERNEARGSAAAMETINTDLIREVEGLKAELAALRNPHRDTRTRVEDGLPEENVSVQVWFDDDTNGLGYLKDGRWSDSEIEGQLYSKRVASWRPLNWSPFAPVEEPIYVVERDGMPTEEGWYWRLDPFTGCVWTPTYLRHSFTRVDWPLESRYQRIRPPETQEVER